MPNVKKKSAGPRQQSKSSKKAQGVEAGEAVELIIAPTEPPRLKEIAAQVSLLPERYGCDVIWWGKHQGEDVLWGVQRKELKDFIASVQDGRLAKEVGQIRASGIPIPMVIIEGTVKYSNSGNLIWNSYGQEITVNQWNGMLWSLQNEGVHVTYTKDLTHTVEYIKRYAEWTCKTKHSSLMRRPTAFSPFGVASNEDWAVHLLQGFQALGVDRAKAIIKHFGGVPLQWTVTKKELLEVPGIGPKIAEDLIKALELELGNDNHRGDG